MPFLGVGAFPARRRKDFTSRITPRKDGGTGMNPECSKLPIHPTVIESWWRRPPFLVHVEATEPTKRNNSAISYYTSKTMTTTSTWCKTTRRRNKNAAVGRKPWQKNWCLTHRERTHYRLTVRIRVRVCVCVLVRCMFHMQHLSVCCVLSGSVCRSWQNSN